MSETTVTIYPPVIRVVRVIQQGPAGPPGPGITDSEAQTTMGIADSFGVSVGGEDAKITLPIAAQLLATQMGLFTGNNVLLF